MRKTNNKVVAGDFERLICGMLSSWWCNDSDSDRLFWRTASSGGRATIRSNKGQNTNRAHCGDICALDERGACLTALITWELKHGYSNVHLHELLDRPTGVFSQYEAWIKQADDSRIAANTPYWAIVHHRRSRKDVMLMPLGLWDALGCSEGTICGPVLRMLVPIGKEGIGNMIVACQFSEFLKGVTPNEIRRLVSHAFRDNSKSQSVLSCV